MSELKFCGYAVPGDRGGPEEACGKPLPCIDHQGSLYRLTRLANGDDIYEVSKPSTALTLDLRWLLYEYARLTSASAPEATPPYTDQASCLRSGTGGGLKSGFTWNDRNEKEPYYAAVMG